MKKNSSYLLVTLAFATVINIIGGQLALFLHLPVYLDTIGTILAACLFGPLWGMVPGILSGIITGITMDIYSLYFMPVQMITGFIAGLVWKTKLLKQPAIIPVGAGLITLPGTLIASLISAYLFGGYTSSGSSVLVLFLRKIGIGKVLSVFFVQFFTDYLDRILAILLVTILVAALPKDIKIRLRGK